MTYIRPFKLNLGDGSDGSGSSSGNWTVGKQVYQWINYTLNSGHTLYLSPSYVPSIFKVQGTLTIAGTINGNSCGHPGTGRAYCSVGDSTEPFYGDRGRGYGGGFAGRGKGGAGGGGGCGANGSSGQNGPYGGVGGSGGYAYDTLLDYIFTGNGLLGLAGSGGGGGCGHWVDRQGGEGGYGGGGLLVIARDVIFASTASVSLAGGNGGTAGNDAGGGGGGSGGVLAIVAYNIVFPSSGVIITALGGSGGGSGGSVPGGTGGAGSVGRIYLCYLSSITPADAASRSNPAATVIDLKTLPRVLG